MIKKILTILLLAAMPVVALFSCKKVSINNTDLTRNFFPLKFGKYVTYNVDSVYYNGSLGVTLEVKSQMKYSVTDTFTDAKRRPSYIMDVYSRPYDGADWHAINVILVTPTSNSILYSQDQVQYVKMMFPISEGLSWPGNQNANINNPALTYLKGWNYMYQDYNLSYFDGFENFQNTVSILEDNEHVNYQNIDSALAGYDTYAKEVYAYNIGMIYKEWTHTTWIDSSQNKSGYSVIMRAIDNN